MGYRKRKKVAKTERSSNAHMRSKRLISKRRTKRVTVNVSTQTDLREFQLSADNASQMVKEAPF